jgi:hypothetical protein
MTLGEHANAATAGGVQRLVDHETPVDLLVHRLALPCGSVKGMPRLWTMGGMIAPCRDTYWNGSGLNLAAKKNGDNCLPDPSD